MANRDATKRKQIQVDETTWNELDNRKPPGKRTSFNKVIVDLLTIAKQVEKEPK